MTRCRKLISSAEAVQSERQHTKPCSDCPWSRESLRGWLGGMAIEEWRELAHDDGRMACHVIDNQQCAGAAIYRANVCKSPRDPRVLRLPADREAVFATPMEFEAHHTLKGKKC